LQYFVSIIYLLSIKWDGGKGGYFMGDEIVRLLTLDDWLRIGHVAPRAPWPMSSACAATSFRSAEKKKETKAKPLGKKKKKQNQTKKIFT
jgi:hypothetical protein